MKKILSCILGDYLTLRLIHFKMKVFPSVRQRNIIEQESQYLEMRKSLYRTFISKGDLCFDVGANVGNRTSVLLDIGAKVVAVEPQIGCAKFLKYKFGRSIEIVNKGLGSEESIEDFHLSNESTLSSFSKEWINSVKNTRFTSYKWERVVKVQMTTLDKLIECYGLPAFIKIDVEGYEYNVLQGLSQPIPMISFEYAVPEQVDNVIKCLDKMNTISNDCKFNYCIGESMELKLDNWLSIEEMRSLVVTKEFEATLFGDIYVRT